MTAGLSVEVRRHAPLSKDELRRQLLALVLAFVLVWYTLVVPAGAAGPRRFEPDADGGDGEVRGVAPQPVKPESQSVEDLDWPEYIYP
jgi:hypothetical protein